MDSKNLAEGDNFLVPNGTFFVELAIFLIVLGVIWKFVVPPIREVLQARADLVAKTADDNHRAARAFADADAKYRSELTSARTEAAKIRDEARGDGQKVLDEMRKTAKAESDAIQAKADQELSAQADQVAGALRPSIGSLSETLTNRVLGESFANQPGRG